MLTLSVTVTGDKAVIDGLHAIGREMTAAIGRGLERIVKGAHRRAFAWLSGSAGASGAYPVPVRTGHLRRLLDWVKPGASKSSGGRTFTAGRDEAILYDSAEYSDTIHNGRGSSAKFGRRPFLEDGFKDFNGGNRATQILDAEVQDEIKRRGL